MNNALQVYDIHFKKKLEDVQKLQTMSAMKMMFDLLMVKHHIMMDMWKYYALIVSGAQYICDDRWNYRDAEVACRQLGYDGPELS